MADSASRRALGRAAKDGDAERVRSILEASPDLIRLRTPWTEAARKGHLGVLEALLEIASPPSGSALLHHVIRPGAHDVVDEPSRERMEMVRTLIAAGADLAERGGWPEVEPLPLAAMAGSRSLVEVLLEAGSRVDLHAASALGRHSAVADLLSKDPERVEQVHPSGLRPLHFCAGSHLGTFDPASSAALAETAKLLIDKGADPNAPAAVDRHLLPPLYWACSSQSLKVIEILLDAGADPSAGLSSALWNGTEEIASLLLERGGDVDYIGADGPLVLDMVHWGKLSKARWLLAKGADPNLRGEKQRTALHAAASRGAAAFVAELLEKGADPTARDADGKTPLDVARERHRSDVVAVLETAGGSK